ncbi:hypothetical protein BHM03_00005764 [Ensete ventricosum]|nr:hypothetical protein BHM03_00005764 [Ensete ventricosum]
MGLKTGAGGEKRWWWNRNVIMVLWVMLSVGFCIGLHCHMRTESMRKAEETLTSMCEERARMLQEQFAVSVNHVHALAILVSTFHYQKSPPALDQVRVIALSLGIQFIDLMVDTLILLVWLILLGLVGLLESNHLGVVLTFPVYLLDLPDDATAEERVRATAGFAILTHTAWYGRYISVRQVTDTRTARYRAVPSKIDRRWSISAVDD